MICIVVLLRLAGLLLVAAALAVALVDPSVVAAPSIEKRPAALAAFERMRTELPLQTDPVRAATLGR